MADDDDCVRITLHIIDKPQHAFEIEIVGRLIEQQQIRFRKQHGSQSHAHTPPTRKG
ncbi:hypothetical protein D3C80_355560 [compost metagenome]